jgi:hypothetical protein
LGKQRPKTCARKLAVIAALCAVTFAVLITWIISRVSRGVGGRIDRAEEGRNLAQSELLTLNAQLETRVQKRTRELSEKNQQMEEELQMARELQIALLPQHFPTVPAHVAVHESALRFLSLYFPTGDVSGDFFSVFPVGEKAVGVFMCDVMGHGVRSALITSMIRALVEDTPSHDRAAVARQPRSQSFSNRREQPCCDLFLCRSRRRPLSCDFPAPAIPPTTSDAAPPPPKNFTVTDALARPSGFFQPATPLPPSPWPRAISALYRRTLRREAPSGELFTQEHLHRMVSRHAMLPPEEFFKRVLGEVRQFSERDSFDDDVCIVGMHIQRTK